MLLLVFFFFFCYAPRKRTNHKIINSYMNFSKKKLFIFLLFLALRSSLILCVLTAYQH